ARTARRAAGRPQPLPPARSCRSIGGTDRRDCAGDDFRGAAQQPRRQRPYRSGGRPFGARGRAPVGRCSASGASGMSGLPTAIEPETGAAGRSQLEFDDNLLLPALYGERDQHLDRIERQLGVSLVPRGNRLSIAGPASATEIVRLALSRLYERLKRGQEIDMAAVEAAMRMAQ